MNKLAPNDYILDYPYWDTRREMLFPNVGMVHVFARTSRVIKDSEDNQPFVLVDVGACVGAFLVPFKCKFRNITIHAIEPSVNAYPYLQANVAGLKDIHLYQVAVSDRTEKRTLSFIPNRHGEIGIETFYGDGDGKQLVQAVRLDELIKGQVQLIKIDVEGHELAVIRGCKRIIDEYHPDFILELKAERQEQAGYTIVDVIGLMTELDYVPTDKLTSDDIMFSWKGRAK